MNKRVDELVEQAKPLDENGQKVRGLNSDYHDQWMKKFAELIIQECDHQMITYQGLVHANGEHLVDERLEQLRFLIKEHFGVKTPNYF